MATYVVGLLSDWLQLFIRDDWLLGPNAPLGRLEPPNKRCGCSKYRSSGGYGRKSGESPSGDDLNPREGCS